MIDDDARCWSLGCPQTADEVGSRRLGLRGRYCVGCLSRHPDDLAATRRWLIGLGFEPVWDRAAGPQRRLWEDG